MTDSLRDTYYKHALRNRQSNPWKYGLVEWMDVKAMSKQRLHDELSWIMEEKINERVSELEVLNQVEARNRSDHINYGTIEHLTKKIEQLDCDIREIVHILCYAD